MSSVLEGILRLPPLLALALVFLLPALEASAFVGVVVPGEIGVVLGGVLANQQKLPLAAVLIAGIAGAVIGDSVGYVVGKRYGDTLLDKIPHRLLKPEHVERTKESLRRLGGKAVFVGRFTAALRALVPGMAGMSRMAYWRTFLPWNVLGGSSWAIAFVLLGYLAGSQYQRVERYANYAGVGLLLVVAVLVVRAHRRRRRDRAAVPRPPAGRGHERREPQGRSERCRSGGLAGPGQPDGHTGTPILGVASRDRS